MTCPNCKRPLADDALYCNNCGHTIVDAAPAGPARKGLKFPAGKHLMDPSWVTCPFCEADRPPASGEKPASELNKTKVSSGDAAGLSKTKVMSGHGPGGPAQSAGIAGHDARIVGALIGQGAVFRTGRTTWRFISFDPKDASGSQQPQTIASSTTKDDDRVPR